MKKIILLAVVLGFGSAQAKAENMKNSQSQLKLSREEAFNFISYAASSVVLSTGV